MCWKPGCDGKVHARGLCRRHYDHARTGDIRPYDGDPTNSHHRWWPTDDRWPWETIPEWCARLDSYYNAVLVVGDNVETFPTAEAMVDAWQDLGRPPAHMGQIAK